MSKSTKKLPAKKLKVGLAFDDSLDRPDGVQQQLALLGQWLGKQGCQVRYLAGQTTAQEVSGHPVYSLSRNLKVSANQNRLSLPLPVRRATVEAVFDKESFDVVHITLPFSPFLGRQVVRTALKRGIPLIGTFHTFPASRWQLRGSYLYGLWLRTYLKRFRVLTSVSPPTQDYARGSFAVETAVIPNFVDLKRFASGKPRQAIRREQQTVLYLTRLVERKGPHHLLEAVGLLEAEGKFSRRQLLLCGRGPMDSRLRQRIRQLKLSNKVLMPGYVAEEDKADYLASADLAVYPATGGEAFGIVLLEAMAAGTLVLAGENPGYRSVLGSQPQLLVDAADHKRLAEKIDRLLADKKQRQRLLDWQQKHIKSYDIDQIGPTFLDIYRHAAFG